MKKVFNSFFVIIAAMVTFAGCAKQEIDAPATPETKTVQFFANSIETKTAFGTPDGNTYPTLWNVGDKVKVLLNIEQVGGTEKIADVECEADLAESARFEVAFAPNTAPESYTYYAVCPSSAYNAKSSADGRITVIIPTAQTPLETTVDKDAQIIYAVAPADADQTSVDMDFHHLTSYGKFSLVNLTSEVSSVSQVKIVAPEDLYISGKWNYLVDNGTISVHTKDMSNEITITTKQTENIWFSCGPVDVSGKTFKFIVTTDKGDLEKTVTFPAGSKFESGTIKKFSLNMTDISVETPETPDTPENPEVTTQYYEKVTSAPADWSGTYLIVYEDGNVAFDGSLTTLDAANNTVSVEIVENKISYTAELAKSSFVIAKSGESYSVKSASEKYIGRDATSNGLNAGTTAYANTLSLKDGYVEIKGKGECVLRFNDASDQMRFRYYKSGQKGIQIYKLTGTESGGEGGGETPELTDRDLKFSTTTASAIVGQDFIEPSLSGEISGVVYSSSNTAVATVDATTGEVTLIAAGKTTITATAKADEIYAADEASYILTVTTGSQDGDDEDEVVPVTIDITFSDYAAGTQYAINEEHQINDNLTLYTTKCHFTTQLRIYSSSTYNGFVVSNQLPGRITYMTFNAGNKVDTLDVYGSNDGSTWTKVGSVAVTSTSYKDYSFSFGDNEYTYFKLDVAGANQVRIAKMSVTYVPAN